MAFSTLRFITLSLPSMYCLRNSLVKVRLKELREARGLTQKQVSAMLQINSVTYLHYEKEQRQPPLALLAEIALFYGVSVDYLLGLSDY